MQTKNCPRCSSVRIIKKGYFKTEWNHQPVPRYKCKSCNKYFSSHTRRETFRQHKPHVNKIIFKLLCSGVTQRRIAKILNISKSTVAAKLKFLSEQAQKKHEEFLSLPQSKTSYAQFDEMETFEHTKLKPLSISLAVRTKTGHIIGAEVATMNCKGHLAKLSQKIYGKRHDTRHQACSSVLECVKKVAKTDITIVSDSKKAYPNIIKSILPHAKIKQILSRKDDHLFVLNHTAAKLRADLTRLHRKTWSTTKDKDRLKQHLNLYIAWNNRYDLK